MAAAAEEADALLIIFTPVDTSRSDEILAAIRDGIRAARGHGSPEADSRVRHDRRPAARAAARRCRNHSDLRVPGERRARAGEDRRLRRWRAQPPGLFWGFDDVRVDEARDICRRALTRHGDGWLTTEDAHAVLHAFGLPVAAGAVARTADEAAALAAVFGFPVVAKLASRQVVHKSDIGAVRLNLTTAQEVQDAFRAIRASIPEPASADEADGVLIQPMVADGGRNHRRRDRRSPVRPAGGVRTRGHAGGNSR